MIPRSISEVCSQTQQRVWERHLQQGKSFQPERRHWQGRLIVAIFVRICPVVQGQTPDCLLCQHRDTTLLDYKMVNDEECHHLSLDFTNIDAQTIIAAYAKLSGLELVVDSHAKMIHTPIAVQAYELTQSQQISLIVTALKEQAGIIITSRNDSRAAVTYDSVLPVKKPKD